jgi:diaminopropionate ammonia-lyase
MMMPVMLQWVTEGYSTMLSETDHQVAAFGVRPNTFFASVGVGSWAQAVVSHYQAAGNRIIAVEPTVAASLKESLHCGSPTAIETGETIMAGMCCGTTSLVAWPVLRDGVHAAVTVTDQESHRIVLELRALNINAGPCGAATLAALRKYVAHMTEEEKKSMSIVLFSTEGGREYDVPDQ